MKNFKIVLVVLIIFGILAGFVSSISFGYKEGDGNYTEYNCDVKNIRLSTDIEVYKDETYVGKIKGNVFKIVTDPLTLYDADGKKLGFASDEYALIDQDSHMLRVDDKFYVMDGQFKMFGEKYFLYDENENYIGMCEFNFLNTKGMIKNANDKVVANYTSKLIFRDYDVKIYENCEIEDNAILMLCGSYYSDQHYRNSNQE